MSHIVTRSCLCGGLTSWRTSTAISSLSCDGSPSSLEPALLVPEAHRGVAGRARRMLRRRLGCRSLCRRG
eukprot:4805709-Prymnesium_polylepis.1